MTSPTGSVRARTPAAGNFLLAAAIEAMGEALALVPKHGIEPAGFMEIVNGRLVALACLRELRQDHRGGALSSRAQAATRAQGHPLGAGGGRRVRRRAAACRSAMAWRWEDIDRAALAKVSAVAGGGPESSAAACGGPARFL